MKSSPLPTLLYCAVHRAVLEEGTTLGWGGLKFAMQWTGHGEENHSMKCTAAGALGGVF